MHAEDPSTLADDDADASLEAETELVIQIDVVEGTDPVGSEREAASETQVAEAPRRPLSPETELVGPLGAAEIESLAAWPPEPARSSANPVTIRTPRQRMTRRLTFLGAIGAMVVVIAASLSELVRLSGAEEETAPAEEVGELPGATGTEVPPPPMPPSPREGIVDELLRRGQDAEPLLARSVQQVSEDGRLVDVVLKSGPVEENRVTVVNLWASWCLPCKQELPWFKSMFEGSDWGDNVRFVPLQVSDSRDPVWAREEFGPMMPEVKFFLSDRDDVLPVLRKFDAIKKKSKEELQLPITLVFDCRRDLRLIHVGGLLERDFDELRERLDQLAGELGSKFCKVRKPKPVVVTQAPTSAPPEPVVVRCGDGRCSAPDETAENCCDCVKCPLGDMCEQHSRVVPRCVKTSGGLK